MSQQYEEFEIKKKEEATKGFELIKEYVNDYPKTQYPSVDSKLLEKFVRGSRLLGINHIILPEDDMICPECKYVHGKIGKKGLSLETSFGNNTLCIYCSYQKICQDANLDCKCEVHKVWDVKGDSDFYCNEIMKNEGW